MVISALWVGVAVMVAKPEAYSALWHGGKYYIGSVSGQQYTLDASMRRDQLMQTLDSRLQQEEARLREYDATHPKERHKIESGVTRDAILKHIDAGERTRRDQALQVWLITIIPPVALLLLGIAIGWVIGGFRKDRSQPV
jgi:hypothetical protein